MVFHVKNLFNLFNCWNASFTHCRKYLIIRFSFIQPTLKDATKRRLLTMARQYFHDRVHYTNPMNSCLISKRFIMDIFPSTHLIMNNGIHVSHMFLMKLNLEECGLW